MLQLPLKDISSHLDSLRDQRKSSIFDLLSSDHTSSSYGLEPDDYNLIRQEAFALGSPERLLDASLSEWICQYSLDANSSDKVLLGFFNAGRFLDVINLYDQLYRLLVI